jgi:hypothetical protein
MSEKPENPEPIKVPDKVDELIEVAKKVAEAVPVDHFEAVFLVIVERVYPKA